MASPPSASFATILHGVLGRFEIRLFLSVCIIVSLLPYGWAHDLDDAFLVIFGLEFLSRLFLVVRADPSEEPDGIARWRWPSLTALGLLALDLLALLSFLPFASEGALTNRYLRIFRLTRMLLLIGYWAPLARDIWLVLSRRERARQVVLMGVMVLALSFTGAVIIEHVAERSHSAIDFDGDGDLTQRDRSFLVLLWWAFRQVQDPGNMIASPMELTAMAVSVGLTVFGLFLVSFLIGLGTDVVRELMELTSLREPGLRGHTVIVNITPSTQRLLHELTRYYKKLVPEGRLSREWLRQLLHNTRQGVRGRRYLVVGPDREPPEFLRGADVAHVVYRPWTDDDAALLRRTDMPAAQRVMLLANLGAADPDAATLQTLLTLVESESARAAPLPGMRPQILIAEILDESAIPAARTAVSGSTTRAFIIPSERLLALYMACTIRHPGVTRLLELLLASHGHELYTCYFDVPGLAYQCAQAPTLPASPPAAMELLQRRARDQPLVPLGLLLRPAREQPHEPDVEVCINPAPTWSSTHAPHVRGFVALAPNFAVVRDFAELMITGVAAPPPAPAPTPEAPSESTPPNLRRSPTTRLHRVLICGFRSATVSLIEALVLAEPAAELLVLVDDADARAAALDDFDAHTNLVRNGLLGERHVSFVVTEDGRLHGRRRGHLLGAIQIAIGDFTSSRQLVSLPLGFGHAAGMDVVLFLSAGESSDARIAKAMMKLEALAAHGALASGGQRPPRVVAELFDVELGRRLRQHIARRGRDHIEILSTQALRALFLFQSVIVPGFDAVYTELLGPWGQSLMRMEIEGVCAGLCTYNDLSRALVPKRALLIAIEIVDEQGATDLIVGHGPDGDRPFESHRLRAAWVIADEEVQRAQGAAPAPADAPRAPSSRSA
ncbi:MAG: hypothetical protein R3B09_15790 [Nannocystaceae bacterium]